MGPVPSQRGGGMLQGSGHSMSYFPLSRNHYSVPFVTWGVQYGPLINEGFTRMRTSPPLYPSIPVFISGCHLPQFCNFSSFDCLRLFLQTGTAEHLANDAPLPSFGWRIIDMMLEAFVMDRSKWMWTDGCLSAGMDG